MIIVTYGRYLKRIILAQRKPEQWVCGYNLIYMRELGVPDRMFGGSPRLHIQPSTNRYLHGVCRVLFNIPLRMFGYLLLFRTEYSGTWLLRISNPEFGFL